jgi:small subunit ribosomal protein S17
MADEENVNETTEVDGSDRVEDQVAEAPAEETTVAAAPADTGEAVAESPTAEAPAAAEPKRKKKRLPRALRPQKTRPRRPASSGRKPIAERTPPSDSKRGRRQERRGVVVSNAMDKTIVVKVDLIKSHPRYKKVVRRSVKFHAHDEQNAANVGDVVRIVETRPLSATKHWRLAEIVEVAK